MDKIYGRFLNPSEKRLQELRTLRFRLRQRCFGYEEGSVAEVKYFRIMEKSNTRMRNDQEGRRLLMQNRTLNGMGY